MRGLRIGPKLISGFAICVILSAIIGAVAVINLARIKKDTIEIRIATDIEKEVLECRRQEKNIMLFGPYERETSFDIEEKSFLEKVNDNLIALRKLVEDGKKIEEEEEEFNAILIEIENYEASLKKIVAHYDKGEKEIGAHILTVRENARRVQEIARKIIGIAEKRIDTAHKTARAGVWLTLILAVVFGGGVGIFLSRNITNPIRKLSATTELIARGDLTQRVDIKSADEIGELSTSFNKMAKDLKVSRDELLSAKDYSDNIIKSMIDTLIVVDPNAKIKTINKATSDLLDYKEDELIDKPVATIFAEEEEEEEEEEVTPFKGTRMKKLIEEGSIRDYEMTYKTKAGEKIPVSFSGSVMRDKEGELVGIVGIAHDMREIKRLMEKEKELAAAAAAAAADRKRAAELEKAYKELRETQAKLIQAGKMAAMGTLGAGIAHQLNQPLAGIRGFTQTVLMQIDKKNPFYEDLKKIEEQTGYMSEIITNIGGFARAAEFKKAPIDINEPIEKALQLFSEQIRLHGIKLIKNLDPKLPKVNADINQMQQVFVNFITNSREALDELPKEARKKLVITTKVAPDNKNVEIIFTDNGPGIPSDIKDRIFEPFFTTKGPRSTGLGLSLNFGMIQDHGGTIEFDSKPGKETTFVVKLPTIKKAESKKEK